MRLGRSLLTREPTTVELVLAILTVIVAIAYLILQEAESSVATQEGIVRAHCRGKGKEELSTRLLYSYSYTVIMYSAWHNFISHGRHF